MTLYLFKTEEPYGGDTKIFDCEEDAEIYKLRYIAKTSGKVECRVEKHHPFPVVGLKDRKGSFYLIGYDVHGNNAVLLEKDGSDKFSLDNYPVSEIVEK